MKYLFVILFCLMLPVASFAHGKGHDNLKVLPKHLGKNLDKGMKLFSKGIGVKCTACHVKDKWASDEKPNKLAARKFLSAAIAEKDSAARAKALVSLLEAMKLKSPRDQAEIDKALAIWRDSHH